MELIKCHIENFGKLQNFDFDFYSTYNVINEQNGWGKTTFACFIKAMFYGMPATTKQNLNENERKKYMPWQGGNYGGYIEFKVGKDSFRIERFFGKKASEDTFKLVDLKTGKESNKYSQNIGEELFELDSEAYERSTYIPQKEMSSGINDKLSTKLINIIHGTDNSESLEKALEIIDLKRFELKKKNNTGKIPEVEAEIEQTTNKIDALKSSFTLAEDLQAKVNELNEQIDTLEVRKQETQEKISESAKREKLIANKRYLEQTQQLSEQLEQRITKRQYILNGHTINKQELYKIDELETQVVLDSSRLETLKSQTQDAEKLKTLEEYFGDRIVPESHVEELMQINEKINEYKAQLSASNTQKTQNVDKKRRKLEIIPLCLALVALVFGCVFVSSNLIVGIVCFAVAVVFALAGIVMYLKAFINANLTQNVKNDTNNAGLMRDKQQFIEENSVKLNQFLETYNYSGQNVVVFLSDVLSQIKEFNSLSKKVELQTLELNKLNAKIQASKKQVEEYLGQFNFDEPSANVQKIQTLEAIRLNLDKEIEELNSYKEKIQEFGNMSSISQENEAFDISSLQLAEKKLQAEIDDKKEMLIQTINKINTINEQVAEINELEEKIERLKADKKEYANQLKMVKYASEFLSRANDNLSAKYLKPMKDGLNKYLKLILKDNFSELNLDTDLNINFETYGQSRAIEYLSKGYQGVVDLCIRFALVDTLFTKEKPFIILDDPFVNMDKEKLDNAIKLIKEASKEYQIIYLICHETRA